MFDKFDEYLNMEFSPDYWYDVGVQFVADVLGEFSEDDWKKLEDLWVCRDDAWKIKCAETIDSNLNNTVVKVLVLMLRDNNPDVIVAAADSLRSIPDFMKMLTIEDLEKLENMKNNSEGVVKIILKDLLK